MPDGCNEKTRFPRWDVPFLRQDKLKRTPIALVLGVAQAKACVLRFVLRLGGRGARLAFDVVGVPGEVTLEAVFEMAGRLEFVVLAGIND